MDNPIGLAVELRPLRGADYDSLGRLWWESWRSTKLAVAEDTTEDVLRRRIDHQVLNGWDVTVATLDGRLAGFLALQPRASVLDQLFIAPDLQRRGIGQKLLALAKERLPLGFTLRTAIDNKAACCFYERAGLTRAGTSAHPTLGHAIAIYRWSG